MVKNAKIGMIIAYSYIMIPMYIFIISWVKLEYALPCIVMLIISSYFLFKNIPEITLPKTNLSTIIIIIIIVVLWTYFSGIGALSYQNIDHHYRNGIFEVLVNNEWPVLKTIVVDGTTYERTLSYYIGFWLPAALIGKVFGLFAGYLFQVFWSILGILVFYFLLCVIFKKIVVWPLIVFMAFGGLDVLAYVITGNTIVQISDWIHLEQWTSYQFSAMTTQLFWVYNQAIPAWILTLLLFVQKDNKSILYIWSFGLLLCTIPFVGMIPYLLYFMIINIKKIYGNEKRTCLLNTIRSVLSFQNVIGSGIIGISSFIFLISNTSVLNAGIEKVVYDEKFILMQYIVTILFEVSCYFLVLYKYHKQNPLYYITLCWLLICPFIKVGYQEDFCMRASIPALLILCVLVINTLIRSYRKKDFITFSIVVVILMLSSCTGISEINRSISHTLDFDYSTQAIDEDTILTGGNFSGNSEDSLFYKYFAR